MWSVKDSHLGSALFAIVELIYLAITITENRILAPLTFPITCYVSE